MTSAVVVAGLLVLAGFVAREVGRVRRLHRLHVRVDGARAGLEAALLRRAEVAGEIARHSASGEGLAAAASAALAARGVDGAREAVENALGRHLARVDRTALPAPLRAALAEAERFVVLGRSVYHDAVRDTLDLRSRRLVRWLRLAGAAPLPAYLEIAVIPAAAGRGAPGADVRSGDRPS